MALSAITPTYAFTNQFPNIPVSGTANKKLLVSLSLDGKTVLNNEAYFFDPDGFCSIRFLGDLLERYFYDAHYDIRKFAKTATLNLSSEAESVSKTIKVYFCRSYIGGDKLSPDMVQNRPLTACTEKHTLPGAKEYISVVCSGSGSIVADIFYISSGRTASKQITLQSVTTADVYTTADASSDVITAAVSAEKIIYYDVYVSGHSEKKIRYWLDRPQSFEPTSFIFQNGFGAVESFVCRGIRKNEMTAERETGSIGSRFIITRMASLRSYTVNTGTLSEGEQENLISMLNSVSLMVLKNETAIPVIVAGQNVSLANFRSKLATAEFTYNHSARNLTLYKYNKSSGIFDYTFDNTFN